MSMSDAWVDRCHDLGLIFDAEVWATVKDTCYFCYSSLRHGDGRLGDYPVDHRHGCGWRSGYGTVQGNGFGDGMLYGDTHGGSVFTDFHGLGGDLGLAGHVLRFRPN